MFDDIARSDLLKDGWRVKEQFGNGQNRDPNVWRSFSIRDFGEEQAGLAKNVLGSSVYELHPGMITENDMARFDVFLLARELLATRSNIIDGISSDGDVDGILNAEDVERFVEIFSDIDNISQTEAEFIIRVARGEGLVDNNFDLNDIVNILGWLGLGIAVAGGIVVLTGGSAALATKLFAASALTEAPVVPIKLYQGDLVGAGFSTLLVLVDGDQIARAFRRTVERAGPALKVAKLNSGLGDLAADFADFGFVEVSNAIKLRGVDVVASQGGDLAYARFKIIDEIEADLGPLTATSQQAEFLAKRYFDDLVSRLDDTTDYDEAYALFNANPAAADAYVRWGNKVFDPVEGPALIEFAGMCAARGTPSGSCGLGLSAELAAPVSRFESSLDPVSLGRWVETVEDVGGDEAIELLRVVSSRHSVDPAGAELIASNANVSAVLTTMAARTDHLELVLSNPNHAADVVNMFDELEYIVQSRRADLAWDLSGSGGWRYRELETALLVEARDGIRLTRAGSVESFDFLDNVASVSYDGLEPVGQFFETQWRQGNIQRSIREHIDFKADRVPVNVADLSRVEPAPRVPSQFDRVAAFVEAQPEFPERVFLVGD